MLSPRDCDPPVQEDEEEEGEAEGPGLRGDGPVCVRDPETDEVSDNVIMCRDLTSDQVFEGNYEAGTPHGYFRHINGYGDLEFFGCFHRGTLLGETFILRTRPCDDPMTRCVLEVSARRWVPGVQVLELL